MSNYLFQRSPTVEAMLGIERKNSFAYTEKAPGGAFALGKRKKTP
jgi:hypothetical protein